MALGLHLADLFPPRTAAEWQALASEKSEAGSIEALVSRSSDGIAVGPLYGQTVGGAVISRDGPRPSTIIQRIDAPDPQQARRDLAADLAGGAGGIELVFATSAAARRRGLPLKSEAEIEPLLDGIALDRTELRIDAGEATAFWVNAILALAGRRGLAPAGLHLTTAFDPISTLAARGRLDRPFEIIAGEIARLVDEFDGRHIAGAAVVADGRLWHDGGASEAQELAIALSAVVAYLRFFEGAGVDLDKASERIAIVIAADADQFLTIAKFRAVRDLHARLLAATGIDQRPCRVHAETAWRMMTRRDPQGNILRTTTAAFAAIVGGADSITVLPFDSVGPPYAFAHRLARNTETVLLAEANLWRVADPGAGSGAIETLTGELAAAAWARFQAIEAAGGLLAAVRAGSLQRDIAKMRGVREARLAAGQAEIVGVSSYPNPAERPTEGPPGTAAIANAENAAESVEPLRSARLAEPFEALADQADAFAARPRAPR